MQSAIKVTAEQLRSFEGPFLKWKAGSREAFATGVGQPGNLQASQLAFVAKADFLTTALKTASLLIVEEKILPADIHLEPHQALWTTPSLKAAMAVMLSEFDPRKKVASATLISPQAFVHPTAKIGKGTRIEAGAFVGAGAIIGDECHLHANAVVQDFCQVGNRCVLNSSSVLGSEGFGFLRDPSGKTHKIPQIGIAVLEDDVELGSFTTIDRATLGETRIGQGTKFDNHCHVAHNCKIGKNGLIAAGFMVAGSTTIGANFMVGGNTVVTDHIEICDNVTIGGLSGVAKSILQPGAYTGYPAQPLKDGLRTIQNLTHITEMRNQLRAISKKIGLTEES